MDLYLDLEGSRLLSNSKCNKFFTLLYRITNPHYDFEARFAQLLSEFKLFLQKMGICDDDCVFNAKLVILDSSNKTKFSKHIIYRLKDCVFANNYICGALMRNFHLHILKRFGEPDTNIFYINPEEAAKKQSVKKCVLDFAVYTKNRDFRLIGSCKRKNCATANPIRWLWMDNLPSVLTEEVFFASLIQRCPPSKYHIARVIDTLNDGVPISSRQLQKSRELYFFT